MFGRRWFDDSTAVPHRVGTFGFIGLEMGYAREGSIHAMRVYEMEAPTMASSCFRWERD